MALALLSGQGKVAIVLQDFAIPRALCEPTPDWARQGSPSDEKWVEDGASGQEVKVRNLISGIPALAIVSVSVRPTHIFNLFREDQT